MTPEQTYIRTFAQRWLSSRVGTDLIMLDQNSGEYFRLNEIGTMVLEGLASGMSLGEVQAQIVSTYACTREQAWNDLTALVTVLCTVGLVSPRA